MPVNSIIDKDYKESHTTNYNLSIQVNLDGFSFIIKEPTTDKVLNFYSNSFSNSTTTKNFNDWLHHEVAKHKVLQQEFAKVACFVQSTNYTIIPSHLFMKEQVKSLLEVNAPVRSLDEIHFNDLPSIQAVLIFTVNTEIATTLNTCIKDCILQSTVKSQIEATKNKDYTYQLNAQINEKSIDIVFLKNNKPELVNNFTYTTENDAVYHLLNIIQQFSLKPNEYCVTLQGKINRFSSLFKLIERFIPNTTITPTTSIKAPMGLNPSIKSNFYSLLVS